MSFASWLRTPRIRRGLAASVVVLAAGGLVLFRTPASARPNVVFATAKGSNSATFSGSGAHGTLSMSHTKVLSGGAQRLFAELRLKADASEHEDKERAPLSIAVVLDTSGSMSGEKIEEAKRSIAQMIGEMRDEDQVALVRYSSDAEVIQPLARLGTVRRDLMAKIEMLRASGGTNIPLGLARGLSAIDDVVKGRVRRVVLVSDGLDSSRAESERIARDSAETGVTISSLGIGLDFDEGYMGAISRSGHGNFGFVKDASTLASFLRKELRETASTTIDGASARLKLPPQLRFVRAVGADATPLEGGEVELKLGSIFAGDERRVVVELAASVEAGEAAGLEAQVTWSKIGGDATQAKVGRLAVAGSTDATEVEEGRDPTVYASAMSAVASFRQIEAAEAYAGGDGAKGDAITAQNVADLGRAAASAPPPVAAALAQQQKQYADVQRERRAAPASSPRPKALSKSLVEKDVANMGRAISFDDPWK